MKFTLLGLVLSLLAVSAPADQNVAEFVVNGEDASIEDYPYMAKVWNLFFPACGGAILNQRSVLTVKFHLKNFVLWILHPILGRSLSFVQIVATFVSFCCCWIVA